MLIMDLFTAWRRLFALPNRQATTILRVLLDEWIHVRGCPQFIYSDADPALMGNICKGLFEALKVNHIATFRYPQANGMVERSFRVVGECFRRMPEDKRHAWPRELPRISFALNVTAHASLGDLSPFEVEHGRSCRLPFDSQFVEVAPADAERKVPGVYGQLAAASAFYRKVAAEAALAARTAGNAALNARGAPGRCVKFKLGDIVVIYLPPAAEKKGEGDTLAARWKAKHLLQWRGPCVVSEVLGGSTYKVREEASGKYFTRSVALMAMYRGDVSATVVPSPVAVVARAALAVGSVFAVVDEPGETSVWLMQQQEEQFGDGMLTGHYYTASSHDLACAVFKPVWIEEKTGLSIVGAPKRHEKAKKWIGSVPDEDEYVKARGLTFRKNGALTVKSRTLLSGFTASMIS
jgi:hypothetical protein